MTTERYKLKSILLIVVICTFNSVSYADDYTRIESQEQLDSSYGEETARAYGNKATKLRDQGDLVQAESYQKKALSIAEKYLGKNHIEYAYHLDNMATIQYLKKNIADAYKMSHEALGIARSRLKPADIKLATFTYNAAGKSYVLKKYSESISLLEETLRIEEKKYGPNSVDITDTLKMLAIVYDKIGKVNDANAIKKRVNKIIIDQ